LRKIPFLFQFLRKKKFFLRLGFVLLHITGQWLAVLYALTEQKLKEKMVSPNSPHKKLIPRNPLNPTITGQILTRILTTMTWDTRMLKRACTNFTQCSSQGICDPDLGLMGIRKRYKKQHRST
jgi:hypothetical protein